LAITVWRLAQWRIFSTTFDTKPNVQIYEKVSNEALNPLSCKTLVVGSAGFSRYGFGRFVVRWLGRSFAFLLGFVWLEKCKCATKSVAISFLISYLVLQLFYRFMSCKFYFVQFYAFS